jgi:hypothetical protein
MVDTSAWIEWLAGSALGEKQGKEFPDKSRRIADLLTCDAHFEGLRNTMYFQKTERS